MSEREAEVRQAEGGAAAADKRVAEVRGGMVRRCVNAAGASELLCSYVMVFFTTDSPLRAQQLLLCFPFHLQHNSAS